MLCGSKCLCVRYVIAPIWHIAIALFPLFLFIWFVSLAVAAAADSGDSVHIVSIVCSGEPQVRDQADLDMDTRGIEAAWISDYTLRPWLFLSYKVSGLEELCIFLHLNIFWDCGKSWTLKWISDYPHLMGLILTDGRTLDAGGGQEMLKWTYSLEYHQQTLSPVSPLL